MKKYMSAITKSILFSGVDEQEIEALLGCLETRIAEYKKGEYLLRSGEGVTSIGLLVEGNAHILQEDFWGNRNIISKVAPGQTFAEVFACTPGALLNVSVMTEAPSVVVFLNVQRILTTCNTSCAFHARVIRNLLSDLAGKNLHLSEKLSHMAQRTTKAKLLSYLSAEAMRHNAPTFDLPYNRQQLADYLSVDRSALSSALCKMRDEGILSFDRNHFELRSFVEEG